MTRTSQSPPLFRGSFRGLRDGRPGSRRRVRGIRGIIGHGKIAIEKKLVFAQRTDDPQPPLIPGDPDAGVTSAALDDLCVHTDLPPCTKIFILNRWGNGFDRMMQFLLFD